MEQKRLFPSNQTKMTMRCHKELFFWDFHVSGQAGRGHPREYEFEMIEPGKLKKRGNHHRLQL